MFRLEPGTKIDTHSPGCVFHVINVAPRVFTLHLQASLLYNRCRDLEVCLPAAGLTLFLDIPQDHPNSQAHVKDIGADR